MRRVGEDALLLDTGSSDAALAAYRRLESEALPDVLEIVPGAETVLVVLGDAAAATCLDRLAEIEAGARAHPDHEAPPREHEIAVRYDGPDLEDVAARSGRSVQEVVRLHSEARYRVAFVGFQPGFAYLAGLPPALATPRRASPRARISAGSVAIGGEWTGVYPAESPGGWNLIGHASVALFDPTREPPALLEPGDRVRFVPT